MATDTKLDLHIRWAIKADVDQIVEIEAATFDDAMDAEEYAALLGRNTIGMVAVDRRHNRLIRGYFVYELLPKSLRIHRLAVAPHLRGHGVGTAMIDTLKNKLGRPPKNRRRLVTDIPDSLTAAHLFLRSQGFNAVGVDHKAETYAFVYTNRD